MTLTRSVTNEAKDRLMSTLLSQGAIIKQIYDYRACPFATQSINDVADVSQQQQVYQGILFSVAADQDAGLTSWKSVLERNEYVTIVEEDTVVKTN